jgi:hypothetical protein
MTQGFLHARRSVLYGNVHVQGQEGHEMFHCNASRALWYLNRGLVDIVSESPPTIKLRFIPGGPGHTGDPYYLTEKINCCVACGAVGALTRHHIVPYKYRRFLPPEIKSHNYHDILLLCIPCHNRYEEYAQKLNREIAKEYGVELHGSGGMKYLPEIGKAVCAARAILNHQATIPHDRLVELKEKVAKFVGKAEADVDDFRHVASLKPWEKIEGYQHPGEYIMQKMDDFQTFTERWRAHFLQIMQPEHLPANWDLKKPVVKDRKR